MEKKNFYAIYSVWTNGFWFDDLWNWEMWIYIYKNSVDDLDSLKDWDIICFLRTWNDLIYLFEFNQNDIRYSNRKDKSDGKYIVIKKSEIKKYKFSNISAWNFKNLYFLKFDTLKSWVRSPLPTKRNILKFENWNDILEKFVSIEKLEGVFNDIRSYTRQYIIWDYSKLEDEKNIYLNYKDWVFWKEYSVFNKKEGIKTEISNRRIKEILVETDNKNSLKILNYLKEENKYLVSSYSWYYDLTRLDGLIEKEEIIENIKNIEKSIEKEMENKKETLKIKNEIEKHIEYDIKNLKENYYKSAKYFYIWIFTIFTINLFFLFFWIFFNLKIDNFFEYFLSKWIYIFIMEFLILYISYFHFNLSNKYLQIIEIYKSYQLLSKLEKWSSSEIDDKEFKKENIRKLFEIRNIVKESFEKNNYKMPVIELVDSLWKVTNINKK